MIEKANQNPNESYKCLLKNEVAEEEDYLRKVAAGEIKTGNEQEMTKISTEVGKKENKFENTLNSLGGETGVSEAFNNLDGEQKIKIFQKIKDKFDLFFDSVKEKIGELSDEGGKAYNETATTNCNTLADLENYAYSRAAGLSTGWSMARTLGMSKDKNDLKRVNSALNKGH